MYSVVTRMSGGIWSGVSTPESIDIARTIRAGRGVAFAYGQRRDLDDVRSGLGDEVLAA